MFRIGKPHDVLASPFISGLSRGLYALLEWGELLAWSAIVRVLLARWPLARSLSLLDGLPHRGKIATHDVRFPSDRQVRIAGACLGRSLARSQYLRQRGVSHSVMIGATGGSAGFRAHAWVAPYEEAPQGFVVLRTIER
jgi:hypothetical protein